MHELCPVVTKSYLLPDNHNQICIILCQVKVTILVLFELSQVVSLILIGVGLPLIRGLDIYRV